MLSIILRVLWVFDVVSTVKRAVKNSAGSDSAGTTDPTTGNIPDNGSSSTGLDNNNGDITDKSAVMTFAIQASIIALICICAWASCFLKAWRLQVMVSSYQQQGTCPLIVTPFAH